MKKQRTNLVVVLLVLVGMMGSSMLVKAEPKEEDVSSFVLMQETLNAMLQTQNELLQTQNELVETQNALLKTQNALTAKMSGISKNQDAMRETIQRIWRSSF